MKKIYSENLTLEYLGVYEEPCGYCVLVMAPVFPEKRKSGLILPEDANKRISKETMAGKVIAMGKECYQDEKTFPMGPHVCVGDWVKFHQFAKEADMINGETCYWVNDNKFRSVLGTENPEDVIKSLNLTDQNLTLDQIEEEMRKPARNE